MPHNRGLVKIMVYIFSSAAKMKGELSTISTGSQVTKQRSTGNIQLASAHRTQLKIKESSYMKDEIWKLGRG